MERELPRQILADGGHVERSPMYHSILLEDLLDLCNLRHAFSALVPDYSAYAARMLGWLECMTHPDGDIALFNDATFGVAAEPGVLAGYAERLDIRTATTTLGDSGYIRLENRHAVVIFDAAPLGPDYQPGHGHADTLSFELSCNRQRAIVNSGISTYDPGAERAYQRGTAAHNTVRIDGEDQSEMWGAFRVARRARPFDIRTDNCSYVEAAHDGYRRLKQKVVHRRRLELQDNCITVRDRLEGSGEHTAEVFFHVAPGASPTIKLDGKLVCRTEPSCYYPSFNVTVPNTTVTGRWTGMCPVEFTTLISHGWHTAA